MIELVITIRKEVEDQTVAQELYDAVKTKLADRPGLKLTGHCANHFAQEEIPD